MIRQYRVIYRAAPDGRPWGERWEVWGEPWPRTIGEPDEDWVLVYRALTATDADRYVANVQARQRVLLGPRWWAA